MALEIECVDRLLLNAYVPGLQVPGQVVRFLCGHLGYPIPSPALLGRIGDRFRAETRRFVRARGIPVLRLGLPDRSRWDDRKLDHVRQHLEQAEREGRFGVVALVVAEEFQRVWSARNRSSKPGVASLDFFLGEASCQRVLLLHPRSGNSGRLSSRSVRTRAPRPPCPSTRPSPACPLAARCSRPRTRARGRPARSARARAAASRDRSVRRCTGADPTHALRHLAAGCLPRRCSRCCARP